MQEAVDNLITWSQLNRLNVSSKKTKEMGRCTKTQLTVFHATKLQSVPPIAQQVSAVTR